MAGAASSHGTAPPSQPSLHTSKSHAAQRRRAAIPPCLLLTLILSAIRELSKMAKKRGKRKTMLRRKAPRPPSVATKGKKQGVSPSSPPSCRKGPPVQVLQGCGGLLPPPLFFTEIISHFQNPKGLIRGKIAQIQTPQIGRELTASCDVLIRRAAQEVGVWDA